MFEQSKHSTSFTPLNMKEIAKECASCKKILKASRFRMKYTEKDGVQGIARNSKCRNCESGNTSLSAREENIAEGERYEILRKSVSEELSRLVRMFDNLMVKHRELSQTVELMKAEKSVSDVKISNLENRISTFEENLK